MRYLNLVGNLRDYLQLAAESEINKYLVFITRNGLVKRTSLEEFDNIRKSGKIAITLKDDDELISVRATTGNDEIAIGANNGRMVRFNESEVRIMGRSASGVKGIDLDDGMVVGAEVVKPDQQILIVTDKGYGKKTDVDEYRLTHRGSKGVKALNVTDKNGMMVTLKCIDTTNNYDIMIITDNGIIIKMPLEQVSTLKRATQGVRLINLKDNQKVSTIAVVEKDETADENTDINKSMDSSLESIEEERGE